MDRPAPRAAKADPCQWTARASTQLRHARDTQSALQDVNREREIQATPYRSEGFPQNSNRSVRERVLGASRTVSPQTHVRIGGIGLLISSARTSHRARP